MPKNNLGVYVRRNQRDLPRGSAPMPKGLKRRRKKYSRPKLKPLRKV